MSQLTEDLLYVMVLEKTKSYNKVTKVMVAKHVEFIKNLDDTGKLALCGAFRGYPGVAGMIILKVKSLEEAREICKLEPFSVEGYTTYKLSTLHVGNKNNNYLL
jgi:uncharacterized protein YciI